MSETKLSHFDASGSAVMVDVSEKARHCTAGCGPRHHHYECGDLCRCSGRHRPEGRRAWRGPHCRHHGDQAHQRADPLCHPLPLSKLTVDFHLLPEQQAVEAVCTARTIGVTGVEMEALTGVSAALLTIYDMCKAVDKGMELGEIHLVEKTGGKSGHYVRAEGGYV